MQPTQLAVPSEPPSPVSASLGLKGILRLLSAYCWVLLHGVFIFIQGRGLLQLITSDHPQGDFTLEKISCNVFFPLWVQLSIFYLTAPTQHIHVVRPHKRRNQILRRRTIQGACSEGPLIQPSRLQWWCCAGLRPGSWGCSVELPSTDVKAM